jgi:hypothetical protein
MKGRTRWFPRGVAPVRLGEYECLVQISRSLPNLLWRLEWDGIGFLVPCPMIVNHWRGQTRAAKKIKENPNGQRIK